MTTPTVPTVFIAVVIVRRGDRFVLVEETRDRGWYLPGGRIEAGEDIVAGALREVREEAGIEVELDGILRFEHTPSTAGITRLRCLLVGHPIDDAPLKSVPDGASRGAAWVRLDELGNLRLRAPEVEALLRHVHEGGRLHPLSLLAPEEAPLPREPEPEATGRASDGRLPAT